MIIIEDYIQKSKEERTTHIKIDEACIERGSLKNGASFYCKGLLAHILDTTIPTGHMIHLCHVCHNDKCANPSHLYWGTAQENRMDQVERGTSKSIFQRTVDKYGLEEAKKMNSEKQKGNKNGLGNIGKSKTEDHRQKISESIKLNWEKRKNLGE